MQRGSALADWQISDVMSKYARLENQIRAENAAALVINTNSRRGEHFFFTAMDALEAAGVHIAAAYPVRNPARLPELTREAIQRGHKLIVIGGGDGTISSVVDEFAGRDVALAVLPLGTGNSFARTLGIPLNLQGAVNVIAGGKVVDVDLARVGKDYFANVTTIGFSADVAARTPRRLKRVLGAAAYALVGLRHFFTHPYFNCRLHLNDQTLSVCTHQVIVANGSHFGLSKITPDAHVDDKQLVVFTMDSMSRWHIVRFWIGLFLKRQTSFTGMHFIQTRAVRIETDPPKPVDVDGEFTTQTPVEIVIAPNALKIIAPQEFEEQG